MYPPVVQEWYNKPDWPFFEQYFSKRLMQPEDSLYLLDPGTVISANLVEILPPPLELLGLTKGWFTETTIRIQYT